MADSFQLKAIITAVDKLSEPLKGMSKKMRGFQKEFSSVMAGAAAMGAGISTAFAYPISQAISFESGMADVKKVVNFETPEQFKQMGEDILNLSTQLPMAAEGIAQIVAAGGQAGIARNELSKFAADAVKMGIAFDQTAEQSGQMMAQWRTAFKMGQTEVVALADKINFLGNNGPANAAKISDIVTRIGPLGSVAGVASGEIAAMGATISGMGVESEIAATGVKNFMLSLTSGKSATASQKKALNFLKINPKQLAADMQKDSKTAILHVLDSLAKVSKADQPAVLTALFGTESSGAIAPLLANLDLLRTNFNRVSDAQQYAGSMQQEYESRAATTANSIELIKNQFNAASITIGSIFLPDIVELTKKMQPFLEKFRNWSRANPDMIRRVLKLGATLVGVSAGVGLVTKTFRAMEAVMKMSTLGKMVTLMVIGAGLIVDNWDTVGPVVKNVADQVNSFVQSIGGWENIMTSVATFTAGKWLTDMVTGIGGANKEAGGLKNNLRSIAQMGVITVTIGVMFDLMKRLDKLHEEASNQHVDVGTYLTNNLHKKDEERGYTGFVPRLKELLGMQVHKDSDKLRLDVGTVLDSNGGPKEDRTDHAGFLFKLKEILGVDPNYDPMKPVLTPKQSAEITVKFDNSPQGMQVIPAGGGSLPWLNYDVGYNRFSSSGK
ncbi:phage tail tape measure protein [Lonsdalea quercina]|uniref:phage tail tape measure protein n=1 Tax=Lonsdalea quercina TaxID=71657 RepID=UPI00047A4226|nr:phage tail tape measure protein [Lonsdalea quercina]